VEAVAEGTRADVESLIAWSHRGPAGARVDKIEVHWEVPEHSFFGFVVRR